jgi:UDP-2,3-diacylglucosamine pyrophosphatase LpxH
VGSDKMSFSKKVKESVKKAVSFISNFEQTAAELAIEKNYEYVICGHIHVPQMREVSNDKGKVMYLNSGDWVENLTALEYNNGDWELFYYDKNYLDLIYPVENSVKQDLKYQILYS